MYNYAVQRLILLMILCFSVSQSMAQTSIVYDPRVVKKEGRVLDHERSIIQVAVIREILMPVFGSDVSHCDHNDLNIYGPILGSFTDRKIKQKAFLYTLCFARPGWLQGIVILNEWSASPVAHYYFYSKIEEIYAINDINKNGYTEIALKGEYSGQGYAGGIFQIVEMVPAPNYILSLSNTKPSPYNDNCGAVENGNWSGIVIRATRDLSPIFTQQEIKGKCKNKQTATLKGQVKPLYAKPTINEWKENTVGESKL